MFGGVRPGNTATEENSKHNKSQGESSGPVIYVNSKVTLITQRQINSIVVSGNPLLGCVHIEIYGIRYTVFAVRYSVFAIRYTGAAVHIEVARAFSVLFS